MQYTVDGVIVREAAVGDNDKLLTIITPENGKISVMAKGSRSAKSKTLAPTQIYTYGNYEIYEKGDYKWLRGASIIESFFEMRNTIERGTFLLEMAKKEFRRSRNISVAAVSSPVSSRATSAR